MLDGWQFQVDKSVPKILQTLGKKTESKNMDVKITYDYETSNYTSCLVTIKIKYSGIINTISIANENIPEAIDGVYTITKIIDKNGIYGIYITNAEEEYLMPIINIENIIAYKIIYNSNGGEGIVTVQRKSVGEDIIISEGKNLKKSNLEMFKYWNTKPDGSGTVYLSGDSYSEDKDLTLYAIWTEYNILAGYEYKFTDLTWNITNSRNFVLNFNSLSPCTMDAGTHYAYCESEILNIKNYDFLRIKITRSALYERGNSGLYVCIGSSQKATDILDWYNLVRN